MVKSLTMVMVLVFFAVIAVKSAEIHDISTLKISGGRLLQYSPVDSLYGSASEDPDLSDPNLVYRQRLDSLEKTISLTYNEYVQHYIDIYLQRKEQIGRMLGLSEYYFPIFEKALKEAGLPEEIKFITVIESALNPQAVSRSGAVGPWQFMYTTAKGYDLEMNNYIDERKDPVKASYAAARYFLDAYSRIGDWLLTIAAFNCGTGAVTRAIEKSGGIADFWRVRPFLPRETQNYVPAFIATVYAMNYHEDHGIESKPANFNIFTDVVPVTRMLSISSIAKAADIDLKELLLLNPAYKKHIVNGSPSSPKPLVIPGVGYRVYAALYDVLNGNAGQMKVTYASNTGSPAAKTIHHKVKAGQTLSHIANQYGVEVQDLKVWNNLRTTTIVPGQSLRVSGKAEPSKAKEASSLSYVVKAGDTLSEIAEKFEGATVSGLKALNGLTKSTIRVGMILKINTL